MKKRIKYISNDFSITDEYIIKYRDINKSCLNLIDFEIREYLKSEIKDFMGFIHFRLQEHIRLAINAASNSTKPLNKDEGPSPAQIFPLEEIRNYYANMLNVHLRNLLHDFSNHERYEQELENEETAFFINQESKNISYLGSKVENANSTQEILQEFNKKLYQIKNDQNLLDKLQKGKKNAYVKFLKRSIEFLKVNGEPIGKNESIHSYKSQETHLNLTHRHHAIIDRYKAEAGIIPYEFNGTEIQKTFGAKRKQAYYSIWNTKGKTYKSPTQKELEIVILHLQPFPIAQKAAINDLDQVKNKLQ